jgi:hypothetical protein
MAVQTSIIFSFNGRFDLDVLPFPVLSKEVKSFDFTAKID